MKDAVLTNGRILQQALRSGVRASYLFLKEVVIALYEFLEEDPPKDTISLTTTEFGEMRGDSLKLEDLLEKRVAETVPGNGLIMNSFSDVQGGHSLGRTPVPVQDAQTILGNDLSMDGFPEVQGGHSLDRTPDQVQADNALYWAVSVGFSPVEADTPVMDVPAMDGDSRSLANPGASTDTCRVVPPEVRVHTTRLP